MDVQCLEIKLFAVGFSEFRLRLSPLHVMSLVDF